MAEIQITTTQNVTINFKAAEVGERILAYIIDLVIKIAYLFFISFLFTLASNPLDRMIEDDFANDPWSVMAILILICSPIIFYTIVSETLLMGQTLGKKVVNIRVVKIDGYRASFLDYFIRWAMRLAEISLFWGIPALVAIGISKKHQRLGGMASGTAVITLKNKIGINNTILQEIKEDYKPTYFSVIKLSDNDVRIVKENFLRAIKNKDHKTMLTLKEKIINVIEERPDPDITTENFIRTIINDYNHFTKDM
ncbi:RDD family protein [Maribacter algarum]|uniref:RDD family protein n=1 Tax=Maribacter algarum (ex Zhang et al. 2020) TaxID=2578118 RepID=A0A5S3PP42_9FLAO|nr:RDD family protein [Maribacter algarum]TMM56248.1 RDD family protein [Maribacter algarum]